jgi:plasmid stability protein
MSVRTVTLSVPEQVFDRLRDRARRARRTVEAEAIDLLTDATRTDDALPADLEAAVAAIPRLDEPALRVAAESRLSRDQSRRLAALHLKRQKDGLTRAEDRERRELMRQYEKAMAVRAAAIGELHRRGVDVAEFVAP